MTNSPAPLPGRGEEKNMRKLMFGLLGLATLGLGAFSAQPVEAQPYYRDYGYGYRPVVERRYVRPRPVINVQVGNPYRDYRPRRAYRPAPAYRPVRTARRCWVERRRVWTNYGWVRRPVEVCRTVRRPGRW
jgi:hypothetical protein